MPSLSTCAFASGVTRGPAPVGTPAIAYTSITYHRLYYHGLYGPAAVGTSAFAYAECFTYSNHMLD
jgi:hypothetical protein